MKHEKKEISSQLWCMLFIISSLLVVGCILLLNVVVDPMGVFGDQFLNWFSYDFTNNPRVAKITYLDKHFDEYDSYIIGCSSTSSYPTEELNKYFGANFYNMIMYGADMLDVENECRYILAQDDVKNIIVNIYFSNASFYDRESDPITLNMHAKVEGSSLLKFYRKYLLLNPQYAVAKLKALQKDTYLTQPFDVFNVKTGAYDKKVRDAEPIGNMEEYLEVYPVFASYPKASYTMPKIDETVASIKRIKEMCDAKNVNVVFVVAPVYKESIQYFAKPDIDAFFTEIAKVTPFWDFSSSSISEDARYFYDETHFRNAVGKMAIAKMFHDDSVYYPEDFGYYVTLENIAEHLQNYYFDASQIKEYTVKLPVLMYHHLAEEVQTADTISPRRFREHMETIEQAGYTPITLQDLYDYVEIGKELPPKSVLITFDDGYESNYKLAFPVLKEFNFPAVIFAIGSSIGHQEFYKDTHYRMTPHFSYEEAKEMEETGLVSIQSHTYDMHQWAPFESGETIRETVLALSGESEEEIIQALRKDARIYREEASKNLEKEMTALSFPHGDFDTLSHVILKEEGIKATFTSIEGSNTLIKGLPQSLLGLKRYHMREEVTAERLKEYLEK